MHARNRIRDFFYQYHSGIRSNKRVSIWLACKRDDGAICGQESVRHDAHSERVVGARIRRDLPDRPRAEKRCVHLERLCVTLCGHLAILLVVISVGTRCTTCHRILHHRADEYRHERELTKNQMSTPVARKGHACAEVLTHMHGRSRRIRFQTT